MAKKKSLKEIFGSSMMFQEYMSNGKFKSYNGNNISNGTWHINKDKAIEIITKKQKSIFNIQKIENNKMSLILRANKETLILNYNKQ